MILLKHKVFRFQLANTVLRCRVLKLGLPSYKGVRYHLNEQKLAFSINSGASQDDLKVFSNPTLSRTIAGRCIDGEANTRECHPITRKVLLDILQLSMQQLAGELHYMLPFALLIALLLQNTCE